jgi:hypothetical protein
MAQGMRLEFLNDSEPSKLSYRNNVTKEHENQVNEAIEKLVNTKTLVPTSKTNLRFIMNIGARGKDDGTVRVLVDGSSASKLLVKYETKMPKRHDIMEAVRDNNYACVIDVKDMFYNIPVHPDGWKYLGVCWKKQYYHYTKAPMGISTSCEACACIANYIASQVDGTVLVQFDDYVVFAKDYASCVKLRDKLEELLTSFGLPINFGKSKREPSRQVDFLSYRLDMERHIIFTKQSTLDKTLKAIEEFEIGEVAQTKLATLLGKLYHIGPTKNIRSVLKSIRAKLNEGKEFVTITNEDKRTMRRMHKASSITPYAS